MKLNYGDNDWKASPLLDYQAGKWKLRYWSVDAGACGRPTVVGLNVGSFTAKEAHEDCFAKFREDTDKLEFAEVAWKATKNGW